MSSTPVLTDAFTYADGDLTGNGSWIVRRAGAIATLRVDSNAAKSNNFGAVAIRGNTLSVTDAQDTYAKANVTFTSPGTLDAATATLYLRDNDANIFASWEANFVTFTCNPTSGNNVALFNRKGGTSTLIAAIAWDAADKLVWTSGVAKMCELSVLGTTLTVTVDGTPILTATIAAGDVLAAGKAAIFGLFSGDTTAIFDNYEYGLTINTAPLMHYYRARRVA